MIANSRTTQLALTVVREIKPQHVFEKEMSEIRFPDLQDGSFKSNFKLGLYEYMSLLTTRCAFDILQRMFADT